MPVKVPGTIGVAVRSAPWMSLGSTLPVSTVAASVATEALVSFTAVGWSSTMTTLRLPLLVLPSVSVATTVKLSVRLLAPFPAGCVSLSTRV